MSRPLAATHAANGGWGMWSMVGLLLAMIVVMGWSTGKDKKAMEPGMKIAEGAQAAVELCAKNGDCMRDPGN